jgi:hypothetical protein
MEAYWRSGGIAPQILDLCTRWMWAVSFTPGPLYPQGKSPRYPLNRRLGGPQSRSGRGGEEKNSQPLPGFEAPIIQPVARRYTTELSGLCAVRSSEMLASCHITTRCQNPEDRNLNLHCRENIKCIQSSFHNNNTSICRSEQSSSWKADSHWTDQ